MKSSIWEDLLPEPSYGHTNHRLVRANPKNLENLFNSSMTTKRWGAHPACHVTFFRIRKLEAYATRNAIASSEQLMKKPTKDLTSTSKFLSLVLRHRPEVIGMQLDSEGWLPIDELIQNANRQGKELSLELLHEVVASCEKKRFTLSDDGLKIRANQGHSVPDVELNLVAVTPPKQLYHGTVAAFLESILEQGLLKRSRNHVHLSADIETAKKVGARRGKPVILTIRTEAMYQSGHTFYLSANGVWLTDAVPTQFIEF
jgi:putative RNA 2'-phosphotransferase